MARRWASLAVLALLGAPVLPLLADDPPSKILDEAATRTKLANDALKASIDAALSKAGKLPADAAEIVLQAAENEVNEASFLTADQKKGYLAQLSSKRKSLAGVTAGKAPTVTTPKEDLDKNDRIREELNVIKALDKQGHTSTAKARLKGLLEKNPDHPALLAYAEVTARQDVARDVSRLNRVRKGNEEASFSDIDKSSGSVPPNGTVAYDKEAWAKANKRSPVGSLASNLSSREKQILAVLDQLSKVDFSFNNTPFDQVIKQLEKELGFNLVISKQTMEEVRLTYESTLNYEIPKNVTKRTLLKSVLSELGLTYVIKGEIVQVVSFVQAKNELRTGILDVGTLLRGGQSAESLINLIKT
ncbi:MAG TPA: DUF4974 domain-containing protein, partial [Gemmatales bacterium]|nr:DUF4974 domain-containing protein [Gemmatales bacterium]